MMNQWWVYAKGETFHRHILWQKILIALTLKAYIHEVCELTYRYKYRISACQDKKISINASICFGFSWPDEYTGITDKIQNQGWKL